MAIKQATLILVLAVFFSCKQQNESTSKHDVTKVEIVNAMKNVILNGRLEGTINLDTIKNKKGLYGLGPESFLTGELLINNGNSYVSRVTRDSTMTVTKTFKVTAPFFVYSNVADWNAIDLPANITSIKTLETFIDKHSKAIKRPFAFKLSGSIHSGTIHVQNLPKGTKVSSRKEAHQGQVNYNLKNETVSIVGFFSKEHQGVFTHHDSFLHMHLITSDESKMGHLDEVEFNNMTLFLPKN